MRTIVAYIEEVCGTTPELGSAISTWTVEIEGHVVGRSQSSVADVRTARGRRKRKSCRKALVKFDELAMLMTIEKPRVLEGKVDANTIMFDLVDRLDEVVVGANDRVAKARIVHRVPKEQRGGARDVRSTGNESWQQTSAEIAESELANSIDWKGHGTERRQSSLVLYQARSRTREVWILQGLQGCRVAASGGTRCRDLMARSAESASEWL